MGKENVPKIRFKGFTDDWEQRELGDVFEEYSEKNHPELPPLTIIQGGGTVLREESDRNLQYDRSSLSGYKMVRKNDFIVHLRSFEGGLEKAGSDGVISPAYHTFHGVDTDSRFYYPFFRSRRFIDDLLKPHVYGIRDGKSIDIDGMKKIMIPVPSYEEQRKIGGYIEDIGNLIILHQRKCEKLKLFKEAMLDKMFPRNGKKIPEIRFKGFAGDWEWCKLRDIADKVREKNTNLAVSETFTNSAEYGVISQRDFFDHDVSNAENIGGYYVIGEDDFVYNPRISVSAPVGPINRNRLGRKGVMSPLYTVFRTHDIDHTFLEYFFKGSKWHSYMFFNGDTGARFDRFSIKNEVFFDMPIPYPQLEEQRVIGRYFEQMDNLIALHQRKYEKIKLFKEAMLDKMFI